MWWALVGNYRFTMDSVPFPPLPPPSYELEKFLLSVENLPIHDFRNSQKYASNIMTICPVVCAIVYSFVLST